jgi:alpha-glucosidase (family GH31 glycosyl hydrolase)
MPQLEYVPRDWARAKQKKSSKNGVLLETKGAEDVTHFSLEAIRPGIFRTRFWSDSHVLPPYRNIEEPTADVAASKLDDGMSSTIETDEVEASVTFDGPPVVSITWTKGKTVLHSDLPDRSYVLDGSGAAHYTRHDRHALHVGLGEKAAPMDLTARGFLNSATDCFGYEVYKTDPMYKHIPLLIKATPGGCVGILSTSHSRGSWSVGAEIDGLWGHFKVYRQDYGGLEEYMLVGRTLKEVVRLYAELAGFPLLVPRWAYGYLSGGYKYTMGDSPPAHLQLMDFAEKLREHDIPCSAHQMSSGYSIAETEPKVRNVFTWNRHRFPDPEDWLSKYHALGIRLLSNIKPFILSSHPDYNYLVKSGGLFTDPRTGEEGVMKLWSAGGGESGNGGHLDFTSKAAFDWWSRGVQMLKQQGVDAMWNDNNEYTLPDDRWQMALDDNPDQRRTQENNVGLWGRALHCERMAKASYDGLLKAAPGERPLVLTRSGTPGTFRYAASSWSGDNMTSWDGMKGANALSLTAGLCLMHCYGHDIGGFEGPQPSPELLLRWLQLGIYSPRFAINCFKTSAKDNSVGETIEPWMYPEITPKIRDTIKRRYEMLPYIYSLGLESHIYASPPQRWVGWGYESDPEVWSNKLLKDGEEQFWFGDSILIGGVYEPGKDKARMYLPRTGGDKFDYGFVNTNPPYEYLASGQWVIIGSKWKESIPVLAKVGGAVPVGKNAQTRMPGEARSACKTLEEDDYRGVEIFPPHGSSYGHVFETTWYDDDGMSREPQISSFTVRYTSTHDRIIVGFQEGRTNVFIPPWRPALTFILLPGDKRCLVSEAGLPLQSAGSDPAGRPRYKMELPGGRDVNGHSEMFVNGHV